MPQPVAAVGTRFAWFIGDIESFDAGRPYPRRKPFAWQSRVLNTAQLAEQLGRSPEGILQALLSETAHLADHGRQGLWQSLLGAPGRLEVDAA